MVHIRTDDLGLGNNTISLANGNSGQGVACGTIGRANPDLLNATGSL
jgi:Cu/Zn superoxide dismutase